MIDRTILGSPPAGCPEHRGCHSVSVSLLFLYCDKICKMTVEVPVKKPVHVGKKSGRNHPFNPLRDKGQVADWAVILHVVCIQARPPQQGAYIYNLQLYRNNVIAKGDVHQRSQDGNHSSWQVLQKPGGYWIKATRLCWWCYDKFLYRLMCGALEFINDTTIRGSWCGRQVRNNSTTQWCIDFLNLLHKKLPNSAANWTLDLVW